MVSSKSEGSVSYKASHSPQPFFSYTVPQPVLKLSNLAATNGFINKLLSHKNKLYNPEDSDNEFSVERKPAQN